MCCLGDVASPLSSCHPVPTPHCYVVAFEVFIYLGFPATRFFLSLWEQFWLTILLAKLSALPVTAAFPGISRGLRWD